ncbi:MAG: copper homeostasis protein CutC, partial [Bacteroidota bacterium]
MLLELAVFDTGSLPIAEKLSIPRIELCVDYPAGGVTPSLDTLLEARSIYSGLIFVMIRPRGGDFVYSPSEQSLLLDQARAMVRAGADGLVAGFLNRQDHLDEHLLKRFMDIAEGLPVTFHRAFDRCVEPVSALDSLMHHGVRRVLSSGGTSAAAESVDRLCAYQGHCGELLTVLAGGGVRSSNVNTLLRSGQLREVHTAAIV